MSGDVFVFKIPVCRVVCAPLFPSPEQTTNGKVGLEGFRTAICTGKAFHIKCDFSACAGNLLIFLFGCAAYRLLFKQTRALRSNSVFKAIALLAKPAKICQRSAGTSGQTCTLIPEGNETVQIVCSTLLTVSFVEMYIRQKKIRSFIDLKFVLFAKTKEFSAWPVLT